MTLVSAGWRRALALLVVAHGLSHALWLRPGFDPADAMPFVLYCVALLGFATAGVGVRGVTPFTAMAQPFLVVASGYSLVLIWIGGAGDAPWVPFLDVVLLLTGLTGIYRRLPIGAGHPGMPHRVAVSAGTAFVLALAYTIIWRKL